MSNRKDYPNPGWISRQLRFLPKIRRMEYAGEKKPATGNCTVKGGPAMYNLSSFFFPILNSLKWFAVPESRAAGSERQRTGCSVTGRCWNRW